jgi:site-specific recombinase XerD
VAEQDFREAGTELAEIASTAAVVAELAELENRAHQFAEKSRAESTLRAYDSDLRDFQSWCADHHLQSLPTEPLTIATYLAALAETNKSPATIRRRLASISVAHQLAGFETPTSDAIVRSVWAGIRRDKGMEPRKVKAARTKLVTAMVAPLGDRLIDVRDRALLLMGFAGALRRSELVALNVDDITDEDSGLVLLIRKSKTDQEAKTTKVGIPYGSHPATCPVRAWRAWRSWSGIDDGPAFRAVDRHGNMRSTRLSDRAVADMVKRRAAAAGLDGLFAGHSMRSGFATEAYAKGTAELAIMRHGRWKSNAVMRGYVEEGGIWNDNAAARLGL